MSHIQRLFRFPWRSRRQIRDDVDAELAFHLERQAAQLIEDGLDPAAARERAIRQFGDITGTRRYCRTVDQQAESRQRRLTWLFELGQDIRLALRVLARHPGFTWPAVGTLAVALAATAIVASFVRFGVSI